MEKVQTGDFIRSFWLFPGGIVWLIIRNDELFVNCISSNMSDWKCTHRPVSELQPSAIEDTLRLLGLQEFPVCSEYRQMPDIDKKVLNEQFNIYQATVKQMMEQAKDEKVMDKINPDLKIVD